MIPGSPPWDGFKWRQKTQWAFRKSKVQFLVGEIEHLKSTLNLLLQVVQRGRQTFRTPDKDRRHTNRAELALFEQYNASERLPELLEALNIEEQTALAKGEVSSDTSDSRALIINDGSVLSAFQNRFLEFNGTHKDKIAQLHNDSTKWLNRMTKEWFDEEEAESHLTWQLAKAQSTSGERDDRSNLDKNPEEQLKKYSEEELEKQSEMELEARLEIKYLKRTTDLIDDLEKANESKQKLRRLHQGQCKRLIDSLDEKDMMIEKLKGQIDGRSESEREYETLTVAKIQKVHNQI